VHHGRIGSADRSLRNARIRDELATRHDLHDLHAFEMEGAGLGNAAFSNGLEWFVVRGISYYGYSRTDKTWRSYASLVAAAYTRAAGPVPAHRSLRRTHPRHWSTTVALSPWCLLFAACLDDALL
jgi:nucleoside phosphorylase